MRFYRATGTVSALLLQGVWPWRGRAVVCMCVVSKGLGRGCKRNPVGVTENQSSRLCMVSVGSTSCGLVSSSCFRLLMRCTTLAKSAQSTKNATTPMAHMMINVKVSLSIIIRNFGFKKPPQKYKYFSTPQFHVVCPPSSVLRPLSSVPCPPSFVTRLHINIRCKNSFPVRTNCCVFQNNPYLCTIIKATML